MQSAPDSAETDRLLRLAAAGDPHAFDELIDRHRDYLRRVVELRFDERLRSRVDPSDVIQDTNQEAFRRLRDFLERRPMSFRLWLRKTAQEQLEMTRRRHLAAGKRAVDREQPVPDHSSLMIARQFVATGPSPARQVEIEEAAALVRDALDRLDVADREVLIMRNLEGLSNQEVAEVLQVRPQAASQRYGRAILRLRQSLMDLGWGDET